MKLAENLQKSAGYACQRIFVAFGKVNNTLGGDHPLADAKCYFVSEPSLMPLTISHTPIVNSNGRFGRNTNIGTS
jgi:hypothetical protein